tara:strand:+ start:198 stop:464 length:267 start_codon:yes stop_codon:yes gene_type:complete
MFSHVDIRSEFLHSRTFFAATFAALRPMHTGVIAICRLCRSNRPAGPVLETGATAYPTRAAMDAALAATVNEDIRVVKRCRHPTSMKV